MTPEEEEAYREQVRAELSKKNDEKVKERIRKEEKDKMNSKPVSQQLIEQTKKGISDLIFGPKKGKK